MDDFQTMQMILYPVGGKYFYKVYWVHNKNRTLVHTTEKYDNPTDAYLAACKVTGMTAQFEPRKETA